MPTASFTALDGGAIRLGAPFEFYGREGATSVITARVGGRICELVAGEIELGDTLAEDRDIAFNEEYFFQGGQLQIGTREDIVEVAEYRYAVVLAVWRGMTSSLTMTLANANSLDAISLLKNFLIDETPTGIRVRPAGSQTTIVRTGPRAPIFLKHIPSLGLLEVAELTPWLRRKLPPYSGLAALGGELFVLNQSTSDDVVLVHVSRSAQTRIYPECDVGESSLIDSAFALTVDWTGG